MNATYIIVDVLIHIITTLIFLTCFFFFYISNITSNSFKYSIDTAIDNKVKLSNDSKKVIESIYSKRKIDDLISHFNNVSEQVNTNNNWVKLTITGLIIALTLVVITIIILAQLPLKHLLIENSIILVGICLIEYVFFANIASQYTLVSSNDLNNEILKTIQKN